MSVNQWISQWVSNTVQRCNTEYNGDQGSRILKEKMSSWLLHSEQSHSYKPGLSGWCPLSRRNPVLTGPSPSITNTQPIILRVYYVIHFHLSNLGFWGFKVKLWKMSSGSLTCIVCTLIKMLSLFCDLIAYFLYIYLRLIYV